MKNILKKIGILGIIIGMLAPFVELPVVNAANPVHLQNYLFLDVDSFDLYADDGGYSTYAAFKNTFPQDEGKITIQSVEFNYVNDPEDIKQWWKLYGVTTAQEKEYDINGNPAGQIFVNQNSSKYTDVTTLIHAQWAKYGSGGEVTGKETDWAETATNLASGKSLTLQGHGFTFGDSNIEVKSANFDADSFSPNSDYSESDLMDYFQYFADNESETWIPLQVTRKISLSEFKDVKYGYQDSSSTYKFYGASGSYEDYKKGKQGGDASASADDIDMLILDDKGAAIHYYWPIVISVEYTVEGEGNGSVSDEWTLQYDSNVTDNSVSNMPSPQRENFGLGESTTVSNTKPKRSGYVFKGWCEDEKECTHPLQAGDEVSSNTATTITLFAQWGKGGTADNEKTGVISYVIGFISVGIVAGAIYLIARKKNLFKQI